MLQAAGTVEDSAATLLDLEPLGARRTLFTAAGSGRFTIIGEGGYGREPDAELIARPGRPTITEADCPLDAGHYTVSRFFETDGSFGFNRCPINVLPDVCECQREAEAKQSEEVEGNGAIASRLAEIDVFQMRFDQTLRAFDDRLIAIRKEAKAPLRQVTVVLGFLSGLAAVLSFVTLTVMLMGR